MSDAIKKLHDYLAKSPSVVYPEDVFAYLPAIETENAKLRERIELHDMGCGICGDEAKRLQSENAKLRELIEDMLSCIEIRAAFGRPPTDEMYETFAQRARELGVEVYE